MRLFFAVLAATLFALVVSAASANPRKPRSAEASFVSVPSSESGIDVNITDPAREVWGNGAAFFDYDNDGDLDLFVGEGLNRPDRLFRQNDDHTFTDVAGAAGLVDLRITRGVKFADYDNDGDTDCFAASNGAACRLWRNNGDGTFADVAAAELLTGLLAMSGAWGDYDSDGFLDLYVVRRREANQLFHNNGDGSFTEVGANLGVDDPLAGLEAGWVDVDNDNDLDLYLSNDKAGGNRLWRNDGGVFTDVSFESGTNAAINSMGIGFGDFDGNGFVDIYLTNTPELASVGNVLYRNHGDGTFSNVANTFKAFVDRFGWGCEFFDADNDGDLDLYVVNWDPTPGMPAARNVLLENIPGQPFSDISASAGVDDAGPGFTLAVADYNNDGYLDMFVGNNNAPSVLYRNSSSGFRWLKVRTVGTRSNRDGIGARVSIVAGGIAQFRDVSGGQSYLSQPSHEVEFGLGGVSMVERVEVRWPSGTVDRFENVPAGRLLTVTEGEVDALAVSVTRAEAGEGGVVLDWLVSRNDGVEGFKVLRSRNGDAEVVVSGATVLPASERSFVDGEVVARTNYTYVVVAVEAGGHEVRSAPTEVFVSGGGFDERPGYGLEPNYPNPFNPATTIAFDLPGPGPVAITIYDTHGRRVRTLGNHPGATGRNEIVWDGRDAAGLTVASGVYYYRLESRFGVRTSRMVVLK